MTAPIKMVNQYHININPNNIIIGDGGDKKVVIPWIDITKVTVFCIDACIPTDFRAMLIEFGKQQTIEFNEAMAGWNMLVEAVDVYLKGAMPSSEW
jgi:hypothetical protein